MGGAVSGRSAYLVMAGQLAPGSAAPVKLAARNVTFEQRVGCCSAPPLSAEV
jgi:hypothetical protein